MKVAFIVIGAVLVLAALLLPIILLFTQPLPDNNWLIAVRDVSVIYTALFLCVGAILFIVMTALLAFIAFLIRDRIVPVIEKVDETVKTVSGTTTFVSESVVSPIIKTAGAAAGARAMVQTLMRRKPPAPEGGKPKSSGETKQNAS
jgi:hypothetical protein